jgi:hypothetical protein
MPGQVGTDACRGYDDRVGRTTVTVDGVAFDGQRLVSRLLAAAADLPGIKKCGHQHRGCPDGGDPAQHHGEDIPEAWRDINVKRWSRERHADHPDRQRAGSACSTGLSTDSALTAECRVSPRTVRSLRGLVPDQYGRLGPL